MYSILGESRSGGVALPILCLFFCGRLRGVRKPIIQTSLGKHVIYLIQGSQRRGGKEEVAFCVSGVKEIRINKERIAQKAMLSVKTSEQEKLQIEAAAWLQRQSEG